jgi:hypothetical protein
MDHTNFNNIAGFMTCSPTPKKYLRWLACRPILLKVQNFVTMVTLVTIAPVVTLLLRFLYFMW